MGCCKGCIEKELKIAELKETIKSLKAKLEIPGEERRGRVFRSEYPFIKGTL